MISKTVALFIILFLHQTTTRNKSTKHGKKLFIILFLHQTTTHRPLSRHPLGCLSSCSYIKPQQIVYGLINNHGCLSSCSYIKPQLKNGYKELFQVVYHLVPTSNHNWRDHLRIAFRLFIILFLHQTTTSAFMHSHKIRCLSSCSYIKPQLILWEIKNPVVVYHLVPTSNHNNKGWNLNFLEVVYHLVPTSNHNLFMLPLNPGELFIILFLHQTTTW